MGIIISNRNNTPIYEQIYLQLKNCIIAGELKEGDMLPSIRSLAKDLRISVITTKRAYDELERDGYIYTVASKGCYVAKKNVQMIREENLKKIENYMQEIKNMAPACNLTDSDLLDMMHLVLQDKSDKTD